MAAEAVCSRCKGEGHRAAACPKLPFFRSCEYCKQVGHTLGACPALRQCTYCKSEGHTKLDCPKLARKRLQASKPQVSDDSKSETSEGSNRQSAGSTASTWATAPRKPCKPALTEEQEKEAKKMEKKLREIAALEARLAAGEPLDALQQQKLENKSKFEDCEVMLLVRSGYQRFVPADLIEAK
eukprot:Skav202450  [mRNA]  locus=scaffold149:64711:65259:+ [translate_table: standard]